MKLTTQDTFADHEIIETLGLVRGNTIRARNVAVDILQSIRNLVGGEVKGYTKMMNDAREEATERMLEEARALGADGVVCVRFVTSPVLEGAAELLAYGTAVRLAEPATLKA